ncbi:uncharacterized protein LOC139909928 [Centroberyx gerrardi]|uniref:uncharacterized protein n=1 Tax=Centroberyx gerrardi TaxID=166262 RepID=UPI003AB05C8D
MNPFEKKLAEAIRGYPHLYDHSLRDSQKAQTSWREIADTLDTSEENVRLKWKNLRDKFSKAKKRMAKKNGCLANEEKPVPLLYIQLAWLCSHVKLRETDELPMSSDDLEEEQDEDQKEQHGPSSVVSTSSVLLAEPRPAGHQEPGAPSKRKRQTSRDTEMNVAEALNKLRDEDELFLLSLLPSLKRLNIKKRMEVRMKFQQVLYEAEFED